MDGGPSYNKQTPPSRTTGKWPEECLGVVRYRLPSKSSVLRCLVFVIDKTSEIQQSLFMFMQGCFFLQGTLRHQIKLFAQRLSGIFHGRRDVSYPSQNKNKYVSRVIKHCIQHWSFSLREERQLIISVNTAPQKPMQNIQCISYKIDRIPQN